MGTGIAHAFATIHCGVVLVDTDLRAVEEALGAIRRIIEDGIRRAKLTRRTVS